MSSQQMLDTIRRLEARVSQLERMLSMTGSSLALRAGDSSITLSPASIVLKSKDITLSGAGRVVIKASGEIKLKGSKVSQD